jgi:hypothetical protein
MKDDRDNPLARHRAPRDAGAAFVATRDGGLALIEPLTPRAEAWLREHVDDEARWVGPALAVEMRYFAPLADAIIAAGFLFERDPLPN